MLSAKWKQGKSQSTVPDEAPRSGQIRSFRILTMESGQKKIELELVPPAG
jgi:hypothetical protein